MAVKNVTFQVNADTTKAQASLNALLQQLQQIKKNSTISVTVNAQKATQQAAAIKTTINSIPKEKKVEFKSNAKQSAQEIGGVSGVINKVSQAVANSSSNFVRLRNVIARTGLALGGVAIGAAITSLGRAAINASKDYEVLKVAFTTFIGNADLAEVKIKALRQFAAETPFTVDEVFKASRTLLGYGIAANELIPIIRTLGDVAGGTGAPLERLALVFGQVKAAGRLYGQDLLQLINAGFNPLQEISRTTGKSFGQLKDEMRKGLVTFEDVNQAFITATSEGGKFFNLTNALANTTQGRLARLSESWNELLRVLGDGLLPTFNTIVSATARFVTALKNVPEFVEKNRVSILLLTAATTLFIGIRTKANQSNLLAAITTAKNNVVEAVANTTYRVKNVLLANTTKLTVGMTVAQKAQTIATNGATIAMNAFSAAIRNNPFGIILTVLALATAAWYSYKDAVGEATEDWLDLNDVIAEADAETIKNTDARLKKIKQELDLIEKTKTGSKERLDLLKAFNKENKTNIQDIEDQIQFVNNLEAAYAGLKVSVEKEEKAAALSAGQQKLIDEKAKRIEKLQKEAKTAGIDIPLSLLTGRDNIETEFKAAKEFLLSEQQKINQEITRVNGLTKQELENQYEDLNKKGLAIKVSVPGLKRGETEVVIRTTTQSLEEQAKAIEEKVLPALTGLNETQQAISGVQLELNDLPTILPYDAAAEEAKTAAEKKRLEQYKEYLNEFASLQDRINKNNEDLRKQDIELLFIDRFDFEEEVEKLRLLDKINQETVDREIDREIESIRRRDITEEQKTSLIEQLEIIRGQEQAKRAKDLQERIYKIERDGILERKKLEMDIARQYDEVLDEKFKKETEYLDKMRDAMDKFYNDIFEDNPFSKGKFITAPRIEFGGTEFQYEDVIQPPIDAVDKLLQSFSDLDKASNDLPGFFKKAGIPSQELEDQFNTKVQLIDEFNTKYGTTLEYAQNEFDLQAELNKEYQKRIKQAKDLYDAQNKAPKKQNIFQFAKSIIEGGAEDPFIKALEDAQREYFTTLDTGLAAEKTRIENRKNAQQQIILLDTEGNKRFRLKKLRLEYEKEIKTAEEKNQKAKDDRIEQDNAASSERLKFLRGIIDEETEARIQAFQDITTALTDFTAAFIDAQIQQTEAAIAAQQKRVDAAKEIADKGNADLLRLEQERLDKLNRQRANYVRQQQSLAAVEIAVNSAIAVAQAAGQPGAPFTIAAIIAAMAVGFAQARAQAQAATTFAKGGYTGDGHQFQEAGTVHKGEFVMNAQRTRQYRPLLEAIHSGRHPELAKSVNEKVFVVNSKSTDERLDRIEKAIIGQKGLQLSIDENGINGIVSRISYKQQRINNRTR